jgi:hypothetical protein
MIVVVEFPPRRSAKWRFAARTGLLSVVPKPVVTEPFAP